MVRSSLVATLLAPLSSGGHELIALPRTIELLEVREDLTGDLDPSNFRRYFRGQLVNTLRKTPEGRSGTDSSVARGARLRRGD